MKPAVRIENLKYSYPSQGFTLEFNSLVIEVHQSTALVGASGSGKSTLLKLISGEKAIHSGSIEIMGQALHSYSEAQRSAFRLNNLGMIFQEHELLNYLSALDNLLLPLRLLGGNLSEGKNRAIHLLKRLDLHSKASHKIGELSYGERQRVAIGRALIHQPALVLADEPTTGQDPVRSQNIVQMLVDLCRQEQSTLIFVTHDEALLKSFDRTFKMSSFSQAP